MRVRKPKLFVTICLGVALLVAATAAIDYRVRAQPSCPCHIFSTGTMPNSPVVANDNHPTELGVQFKPQVDGYITGIRFYKDASMVEVHTGNLWAATGSLLASGTFSGETGAGWQDLVFATPVHVTANTVYVASYFAPTGKYIASSNYFTNAVSNYPLLAPASASVYNGNGVFSTDGDVFPHATFNAGNYWVDVTFRQTVDGTTPAVTATTPTNGASNAAIGGNIAATVSQTLDASSVSDTTVALTDAIGTRVPSAISYQDATHTITLTPTSLLAKNTTYTATIHGGNGGIKNLDGTAMTADYQWSFATGSDSGPWSIWNNAAPSGTPITYTGTSGGEEFGATVHTDSNGYLGAVRFYKPLRSTATLHAVHVWTASGVLLGSGVSSHETAVGWQEVRLNSPVPVQQGVNYIISYYSSDNVYVSSLGALSTQAGSGLIHANANGSWYHAGSDAFPDQNGTNNASASFWVDAILTTGATYTAPFTVAVSQPLDSAYGVTPGDPVTFNMTNAVDTSTLSGNVTLKNISGQNVAGSVTYDDTGHTISFTPAQPLATNARYTASLGSGIKDVYGTALSIYSLAFTTGAVLNSDINQGMGGPVLVLTSIANPYDTYLAEMLRAEGINYFDVKDISALSPTMLANYKLVLLGKANLASAQVTTLTNWVNSGGNMITFQPDKQLTGLLGLSDQSSTLSEGYLKVDTTADPGLGITAETMQYHGSADIYSVNAGTQVVAKLFSDATTATISPAVTERPVGSGYVGVFTYDLPKSIALTHQGNPAWAGQERDGNAPIRPNDLFVGNGATDWLNTAKAHIPQADEQQRLLINMMLTMTKRSSPLPRYWILPNGLKSALVMTMDDHGTPSGTLDVFNDIYNYSATNCSIVDWTCQRSGALLYSNAGLTNSQAATANSLGFAIGVHIQTDCNATTGVLLNGDYTSQLSLFRSVYPSLPPQNFDRTHCYVWPDWDSVAKIDAARGFRINYNYEWYPNTWTGSNTGYLSGSGMAMRFTDTNGNLIDTYQGVTDLDFETDPTSVAMNIDLDNTINSNEFYGVLGTHYDRADTDYYQRLIEAATARHIPMISASQYAVWKDALGSSTFTNVTSTPFKLDFTAQVAEGGEGMQAMVPTSTSNGNLTGITHNGATVMYTTNTIKGVAYAVFDAQPGPYEALYGVQLVITAPSTTIILPHIATANSSSAFSTLQASVTNQNPLGDTSTTKGAFSNLAPAGVGEIKGAVYGSSPIGIFVGGGIVASLGAWWFIAARRRNLTK